MSIREATAEDAVRIREIAEQTFQTSYALSPGQIETLVEELFAEAAVRERVTGEDHLLVVDESDEGVTGFADLSMDDDLVRLEWLHVEPGHRGGGVGKRLFEAVQETAQDRDTEIEAHVLSENSEGQGYCEQFGFERTDEADLGVGGMELYVHVYSAGGDGEMHAGEPEVDVPDSVEGGGETRYLDRDAEVPGNRAPFFHLFEDEGHEERWGFFCSNCGSTETVSDSLDRVECQQCGNVHRPDEWDDAYL